MANVCCCNLHTRAIPNFSFRAGSGDSHLFPRNLLTLFLTFSEEGRYREYGILGLVYNGLDIHNFVWHPCHSRTYWRHRAWKLWFQCCCVRSILRVHSGLGIFCCCWTVRKTKKNRIGEHGCHSESVNQEAGKRQNCMTRTVTLGNWRCRSRNQLYT